MSRLLLSIALLSAFAACVGEEYIEGETFAEALGSETTQIEVDLAASVSSGCVDVAKACGELYGEIHSAVAAKTMASCAQFANGCGFGMCLHREDQTMSQSIEYALEPSFEVDAISGELTLRVEMSFAFRHESDTTLTCKSPLFYNDIQQVATSVWSASDCLARVTEQCPL